MLFRDGPCGAWVVSEHFTVQELIELGFQVRVEQKGERVESVTEARVRSNKQ